MNRPRNGKIAKLPSEVREQLNRRLQDGEEGKPLVAWLNSLPQVRAVLAADFGGKPVREQNLSDWRKGGYRDWLLQQDAMQAMWQVNADAVALQKDAGELTDAVALWLTSRYLVAARQLEKKDGSLDWKMLREFCSDIVALRRGDHSNARLIIDSKRQIAQEAYAKNRWKRRVIQGLETLEAYVSVNPKAKALYSQLMEVVGNHYDKMEGAP